MVKYKTIIHKDFLKQFLLCFQNYVQVWSFGANFDFSIVETAERQSLDLRAKSFWLRHPQVLFFVFVPPTL